MTVSKKNNGNGRYIVFDNWPEERTIEEIEIKKGIMDFWTITTAEELMSDMKVKDRAKKIGLTLPQYQRLRSKHMDLHEDGVWRIKVIQS